MRYTVSALISGAGISDFLPHAASANSATIAHFKIVVLFKLTKFVEYRYLGYTWKLVKRKNPGSAIPPGFFNY
ncbi:hypothetical protein DVR12_22165 [Chitinophaga silvatica]|uniref:Uncharacterized protein n=1 Tax=Chitinophaga silvatica TaxID=2282649 RepID=A0A3E1Y555_9BACT|nr:hypothetical protein DVR12_22165 [Chitinophaga silvatica]